MTIPKKKLEKMGLTLPPAPGKGGVYASVKSLGNNFYYISKAVAPTLREKVRRKTWTGSYNREGQEAAKRTILNYLSVIQGTHRKP